MWIPPALGVLTCSVLLVTGAKARETSVDASIQAQNGHHFVWRVAKGGAPVAWLVGSIHVLTKDVYPLPGVFQQAFAESGVLVEEVDLDESNDLAVTMPSAAKAFLAGDKTLSQLLDRETYGLVESRATVAGVPMVMLEHVKPWLVAITLSVPALRRAGFDPALGLDRHFFNRAKAEGRRIRGLETLAYQIDRLDGLSLDVQTEMLRAVLSDVDTQVAAVGELVAAWRNGDVAALERVLLQEYRESPQVYQRLVVERNRAWAPKISECAAEPRPCLVVVGGAHLVGPDSVIALLRTAGFSVEQR